MSVSLEGLMTMSGDETRALAMVKVDHNGQTYDWQIFVPPNTDLSTFINNVSTILVFVPCVEKHIFYAFPLTHIILIKF